MEIFAKIVRWQKKHKVNGKLMGAKGMAPSLGYKATQWSSGTSGNAPRKSKMRNNNRRPYSAN